MSRKQHVAAYPMVKRMCLAFTLVFGLGTLVTGYLLLFQPVKNWLNSGSWLVTTCTIEKADVSEYSKTEKGRTTRMYQPRVLYSYQVNGTAYTSEKLTLSGFSSYSTSNKAEAQSYLTPFLGTASRTCLVNPADPREAVLSNEFPTGGVLLGGFMTVIFGGVSLLFLAIWKRV